MHLAAANGHLEVIKFLLNLNVDPNPVDRWGCTPLNDATDKEIIDLLTKNGGKKSEVKIEFQLLP